MVGEDRRESKRGGRPRKKGFEEGSIGIEASRGPNVNDWTRWWRGVARSTGTNRFIDELSRIKAGPTGRPRAISHANVFPLNFEKLFYHRFPVLAISVAPKCFNRGGGTDPYGKIRYSFASFPRPPPPPSPPPPRSFRLDTIFSAQPRFATVSLAVEKRKLLLSSLRVETE